ncbi:MAG: hypothetical protein WBC33_05830, partial [Conexibacter sp.]
MIAESPDATRTATRCAWCEQPLAEDELRPVGRVRCPSCGATTVTGWSSESELARLARAVHASEGAR